MATTPTGYGRFIGRVGALAVALGIGAAIANSPGIAWAQDDSSGASDSSSGGTGTSNEGSTTGASGSPSTTGGLNGGPATSGSGSPSTTVSGSTVDSDASGENEDSEDDEDDDEEIQEAAGGDEPGDDASEEQDDETTGDESSVLNPSEFSAEALKNVDRTSSMRSGRKADTSTGYIKPSEPPSAAVSKTVIASTDVEKATTGDTMVTVMADVTSEAAESTFAANVPESTKMSSQMTSPEATVSTGSAGVVSTVLSALGFGSQAASGPALPQQSPMLWAMLSAARREIGHIASPAIVSATGAPIAALVAEDVSTTAVSPLATPEQLEAERLATQTANSFPVTLMKLVLRQQFLSAAHNLYGPNGVDAENMAALDRAVNEYAMAAAFQQLLLDSMNPTVVTQVAPPHTWFGQNVPGSRILYDNPDTIYRFMGVNGASEYEIRGQFHDWDNLDARPSNVTFSVLEGLAGTTTTVLTVDDEFEVDANGNFVITVSMEPANGRPNHLQLTKGSTIIAARDTLGDWNDEIPMSLSIERVGGPPDSLFAQLGGFAFLGNFVVGNPLLTSLVSLIPPLPHMPPVLRGVFSAAILIVRGGNEQAKYMALATNDPETGEARAANTVSQPTSNAEFLANQLQSNGHFQLGDEDALVLTIDPGDAGYFVVPTYNIWTITDNYWDEPASLNMEQLREDVDENGVGTGKYTVVISPTDPLAANWISTSGLNQGTLAIRFQDIDPLSPNQPSIVNHGVMNREQLDMFLSEDAFISQAERDEQLALRRDGFDRRWSQL